MFIRIWHKAENVGRDDIGVEGYVAIRYITRFYARKYEGEKETRYMVTTSTETSYITEETFEYLKALRDQNIFEKGKPHISHIATGTLGPADD